MTTDEIIFLAFAAGLNIAAGIWRIAELLDSYQFDEEPYRASLWDIARSAIPPVALCAAILYLAA